VWLLKKLSILVPPQIAKFIRKKVQTGGSSDAGEVVRAALRHIQQEAAREARAAGSAVDRILAELGADEQKRLRARVEAGLASIDRGEFTEYAGRAGLRQLAAVVKSRGRERASHRPRP
jgi:antitoxin ParD1/3/4